MLLSYYAYLLKYSLQAPKAGNMSLIN